MSLPPEAPAKVSVLWSTAIWAAFAIATLLFWNFLAQYGAVDVSLPASAIGRFVVMSTLVFAVLYIVARRFSAWSVFGVSIGLIAAIVAVGLAADIAANDEFAFVWVTAGPIIITALVAPLAVVASLAAHFPASPRTNRRTFAAMAALALAAAAPGASVALTEPPFYALMRHNSLAAINTLLFAASNDTGGDICPPDNGESPLRRAVRASALTGLPAAVQFEYARQSDAVGMDARATIRNAMYTHSPAVRDVLLAEIARQGGAASGPDTWWLFDAATRAIAERPEKRDGHRDTSPPGDLPVHDAEIEAVLLDRLAMAYTHDEVEQVNEAGKLAEALSRVTVDKDAVALRMVAALEAKPEIAGDIWLSIGRMQSAAANEKLGAWIVANGSFERAYETAEHLAAHTIAKASPPLREAFLAKFRAAKPDTLDADERRQLAESEWAALQSWETPPEVTADLSGYLSDKQPANSDYRPLFLSRIASSQHPKARAIVAGAIPGILAVNDEAYSGVMNNLLIAGMAGDTRLIDDAMKRFGGDGPPERVCSNDRHNAFRTVFNVRDLKTWFATDEAKAATLRAFDILALNEECRDWLQRHATSAAVMWPALRERSIKALAGCDGSAAQCPGEPLRYLAAIAPVDAGARAVVEAFTARGERLP